MNTTPDTLKRALANAPASPGPVAEDLRGWWTPDGWYVCAECAGRIMARGCRLPTGSTAAWADRPQPYGDCCCCK